MKWRVVKWDNLDGGNQRGVFLGTERKARAYYAAAKAKAMAHKTHPCGLKLLRLEKVHSIIMEEWSSMGGTRWVTRLETGKK